jgi:hypothetical protein
MKSPTAICLLVEIRPFPRSLLADNTLTGLSTGNRLVDDEQVSRPAEKLNMFAVSASVFGNVLASLDQIRVCFNSAAETHAGPDFWRWPAKRPGVWGVGPEMGASQQYRPAHSRARRKF